MREGWRNIFATRKLVLSHVACYSHTQKKMHSLNDVRSPLKRWHFPTFVIWREFTRWRPKRLNVIAVELRTVERMNWNCHRHASFFRCGPKRPLCFPIGLHQSYDTRWQNLIVNAHFRERVLLVFLYLQVGIVKGGGCWNKRHFSPHELLTPYGLYHLISNMGQRPALTHLGDEQKDHEWWFFFFFFFGLATVLFDSV